MLNVSLLSLALALQAPTGPTPIELAWGDLNSDGLLDLLIVDEEHKARFYLNTGDGDFAERTTEVGLAGVGDLRFGAWQDLDADGHADLLFGTGSGVRLFQNVNGRSLVERTAESGLAGLQDEVLICGWIDFDADGYTDMQLMTRTSGYLLRNEGLAEGQGSASFVRLQLAGVGLLPAAPAPLAPAAPGGGQPGGPGIQPAMVNSVLALRAMGCAANHPAVVAGVQAIDEERSDELGEYVWRVNDDFPIWHAN